MDPVHSDRPSLPPIKVIESEKFRRDEPEYPRHSEVAASTMTSAGPTPATYHSGPPPPYSAAPPSAGHVPPPLTHHPDHNTRRHENREGPQDHSKALLPSLHEALGVERRGPYPTEAPVSAAPHLSVHHAITRSPPSPRGHHNETTPPHRPQSYAPLQIPPLQPDTSATRYPPEQYDHRRHDWPEHHSVTSATSYRQRTPPSALSQAPRPTFSAPEPPRPYETSPLKGPSRASQFQYGYTSQPAPYSSAAPTSAVTYPAHTESAHAWRPNHPTSVATPTAPQPYGDSVKRHLDLYDFEVALNQIADHSTVTLDFSRSYGARLHQSHRSGITPGVLPAITEVDALINKARHTVDALGKMREVLLTQQALYHQQAQQEQHSRLEDLKRTDSIHQQDDGKTGGFAGAEPKKRRGRSAAPGRCHSCNRAETPEWRRGPDGARTLCNACGLHYAKLTRKAEANKATAAGASSSNPRTKNDEGMDQ